MATCEKLMKVNFSINGWPMVYVLPERRSLISPQREAFAPIVHKERTKLLLSLLKLLNPSPQFCDLWAQESLWCPKYLLLFSQLEKRKWLWLALQPLLVLTTDAPMCKELRECVDQRTSCLGIDGPTVSNWLCLKALPWIVHHILSFKWGKVLLQNLPFH